MGGTPYKKKGLVTELFERIEMLERRLDELENNKTLENNKVDNTNRYYTLDEISNLTGFAKNTLYKKISLLEKDKHYFKPNGGKLLFDESSIDFLIKGENQSSKSICRKRQPIFLNDFLHK